LQSPHLSFNLCFNYIIPNIKSQSDFSSGAKAMLGFPDFIITKTHDKNH